MAGKTTIMGRTRDPRNKDLERYVKRDKRGYVRYKHPKMDKPQFFGTDVAAANEVARIVNAQLSSQKDVIQKILNPAPARSSGASLAMVIKRFEEERIPEMNWSEGYQEQMSNKLKTLVAADGDKTFADLDVLAINDLIDSNFRGDGRRVALFLFKHLYEYALGKGLHKGPNYAEQVLDIPKADRVRHRIANYTDFLKIREHAIPMVQDAMDLSIITLQARLELCQMKLKDEVDGKLRVIRQKTAKKPGKEKASSAKKKASEKLDKAYIEMAIGPDLRRILHRCKVTAMKYGSPYMLNHASRVSSKHKTHRTQVLPDFLSGAFTDAVNACKLYDDLTPAQRPTLHEVRSLGGRIYKAMGKPEEFIQDLYGHADLDMTEHYLEGDKIVWSQACADMDLSLAAQVKVAE